MEKNKKEKNRPNRDQVSLLYSHKLNTQLKCSLFSFKIKSGCKCLMWLKMQCIYSIALSCTKYFSLYNLLYAIVYLNIKWIVICVLLHTHYKRIWENLLINIWSTISPTSTRNNELWLAELEHIHKFNFLQGARSKVFCQRGELSCVLWAEHAGLVT